MGIARKARPLDHLQNRYFDFQKRMMSNASLPIPEPRASTSQVPRQALATTASSLPTSSSPSVRTPSSRGGLIGTSGNPTSSSNSRIQIFLDPSGSEAHAAHANHNDMASAWEDLGTRKTRIKENVPEVKKLAGTTLKQAGRSKRIASSSGSGSGMTTSGSGSKIVPFRDPPVPPAGDISMPPPLVPTKEVPRGFIPLVDQQVPESAAGVMVPGTPKFTPFRDEVCGRSLLSYPVIITEFSAYHPFSPWWLHLLPSCLSKILS